jgi:hypothetical protein
MIENPFAVGDVVLASRGEGGEEAFEEGKVVDAYTLIIGAEERPMVVVEFPDGNRAYLQSNGPDVRPMPQPEGEPGGAQGEEEATG